MSNFDADVLIIGAGPTGLIAAALLARSGIRIRILDKSPTAAKESRAFGVMPRTLEIFDKIGISDAMLSRGLVANGAEIFVNGDMQGTVNFTNIGRNDTPFPFVMMLPQRDIEVVLNEDIEKLGVKVERGVEVTGFEQSVEGVTVNAKNADGSIFSLRSAYIIGADGAHSIVRQTLGIPFEGAAYEQSFMLADCKLDWNLSSDRFKVFLRGREFALYFPLPNEGVGRIIAIKPHENAKTDDIAKQGSAPATLDEVQEAFRAASGLPVNLSDAQWLSRYRVHHRCVSRYSKGRAFLAGDAAHIHSPVGAQGMNTGLQDATNLCWKLAMVLKGAASNALLDTYHAERWPVGQKLLNFTDRAFSLIASQDKSITMLRNVAVMFVANVLAPIKAFRRRAFAFVSQLGIRYHGNGFLFDDYLETEAVPKRWRRFLTPGTRAPDAAINHTTHVFDLLKGYQFHALAISYAPMGKLAVDALSAELNALPKAVGLPISTHIIATSLMPKDERLVRAERNEVFEAYLLNDDMLQAIYLVRPDGHIAYRSDRFDIAALTRFIKERLTGIG